jgi:hypothetical protein
VRKSYKGEFVFDKAELTLISQNYTSVLDDLEAAMAAEGFDADSISGALVQALAKKCATIAHRTSEEARTKRPGRPKIVKPTLGIIGTAIAANQNTSKPRGRPRKASPAWEDLVYEMVETRRVIQEVLNETNGSAKAAIDELFNEKVLPLFNTNARDTRIKYLGRLVSAYKRAKKRASKKVQK